MESTRRILFRPTGLSLLVGLIELHPGNFEHYSKAVKPFLKSWGKTWSSKSKPENRIAHQEVDPRHFYRTSSFVGLGAWDMITLTIMSEKGLATHLPFIGHARGQSYFYAHDFSIVLDASKLRDEKKLTALAHLAKLASKIGVTDLVRCETEEDWKIWSRYEGKAGRRELVGSKHYRAHFRPISLNHTNGGLDFWGFEAKKGQNLIKKSQNREKQLLGLFKLKLNQALVINQFEWVHSLAFLTILAGIEMDDKSSLFYQHKPGVLRPMYCDGYFDIMLLARGNYLAPMEASVQKIKYLTVREAMAIMQDCGIAPLLEIPEEERFLSEPLFELSHSIVGFSNTLRQQAQQIQDPKLAKLTHDEILAVHPSQNVKKLVGKAHRAFKRVYSHFNHPKSLSEEEKDLFKMMPSTVVAVNAGMLTRTIVEIERFWSLIGSRNQEKPRFHLGAQTPLLYGSHDLELFPGAEPCFLGDLLADHQFLKYMMLRRVRNGNSDEGHLFWERNHSPILSLDTRLGPSHYRLSKEEERRKPPEPRPRMTPRNSPCIFTIPNINHLLETLDKELGDNGHDASIIRYFEERKAFWKKEIAQISKLAEKNGENSGMYLQSAFNRFLKRFFGLAVSPETLESLLTVFLVVDNGLSDPLRFNLFLDLRCYMNKVLASMLTMSQVLKSEKENNSESDKKIGTVRYVDIGKKYLIEKKVSHKAIYHGVEAHLLNIISLLYSVSSQRSSGCFPFHDRSYSRVSDLRTLHTKKLVSVSWMVNDIIRETNCILNHEFPRYVTKQFGAQIGSRVEAEIQSVENPADYYLARFSNSPEAHISFGDKSISLNARQLTSIESFSLLFHEIGHIFELNLRISGSISWDETWKEVCADLFAYKLCFSPLDDPRFLREAGKLMGASAPLRQFVAFSDTAGEYDMADFFTMAWLLQLIQMPKMIHKKNFEKHLLRLSLTCLILKSHKYVQCKGVELNKDLYEKVMPGVDIFFKEKAPRFLRFLQKEHFNEGPQPQDFVGFDTSKSNNVRHHNLLNSFWLDHLLKDFAMIKEQHGYLEGRWSAYCETITKKAYQAFISFLANSSAMDAESPYLRSMVLGKTREGKEIDISNLLNGLLERLPEYKKPGDYFAAASQVIGLTNLMICGDESSLLFLEGYPGFSCPKTQQRLAQLRQLTIMLMLHGGSTAMNNWLGPDFWV